MDNHYSLPRRSLGASGADHLLLGIGAAVTLDYAPVQEHRLKVAQDSARPSDTERARCVREDHDALQNATLAIPRDPRARPRIGHRIDCKGAAVRQIPSPATTIDTDLDRSPLSPLGPDERYLFDRIPFTRSPEMMEVTPDPVATMMTTIPVITIGMPSPPARDSNSRNSRCCPSHLSDNGSSPRFQAAYPGLQTGVGLKQLCDVSPQGRGHALPTRSDSSPCKCCSRSQYETPISPVESVGAPSAQFDFGHCQTFSSSSGDSAYGSATSTTFRQPSNPRSRFLRIPSPLRDNQSNQPLTAPPSSLSTRSTSGDSREAPQPRPSGPSNVFVCRIEGCFDRNRCFFLDMESRNEHELRDKHSLDYPKATQKTAQKQHIGETGQQTESSSQGETVRSSPPQTVAKPHLIGNWIDAGSDSKMPVACRSQESNLMNKASDNTEESPRVSAKYPPEIPAFNDTTMSPASSVASQATPSTSSTLSSEMELLKPMPNTKIDEMIDRVMEECEGMFDYFLGFDIHDDSVDMSDAADSSDSESDSDDDDDVVSVASPMSQRPSESSPPSSSSSPQSVILGSRAKCHTVAGDSNSTSGTPKAATNARAGRPSNSSNAQRKRKGRGSNQQEEDDDDGNSERKKRQKDSEEDSKGPRFACPFWQKHGRTGQGRTRMHASCVFPGFSTVARLKEHLYRCHLQPAYCVRCCKLFNNQQELNSHHLSAERCPDIPDKPVIDGITDDQARQLRSRKVKEGVSTEKDKWINVYFILFPSDTEPPSPYCVSNQDAIQLASLSPESIMFQEYEVYSRHEFPRLLRAEIEKDAEVEAALMKKRLRSKMVDAARRATEQLYTEFRRNRLQANTGSVGSGGDGPSQQSRASVPGQMEFLAAPAPQSETVQDARTTVVQRGGSRGPSAQADATSVSDSAYGTGLLSDSNVPYPTARHPASAIPGDLTQDRSNFDGVGLHLNAMIGGSDNPIDDPGIMQAQYPSAPDGPHQQQQPEWYGCNFDFLDDRDISADAYPEDPSLRAPFPDNSWMGGDSTNRNG